MADYVSILRFVHNLNGTTLCNENDVKFKSAAENWMVNTHIFVNIMHLKGKDLKAFQ